MHELWLALKQERLDLQGQLQGTAAVPDAVLSADLLPLHSTTPPCTIPPLPGSYGDGVKYGLYYRPGEAQLSTFGNVRRTGSLAAHAAAATARDNRSGPELSSLRLYRLLALWLALSRRAFIPAAHHIHARSAYFTFGSTDCPALSSIFHPCSPLMQYYDLPTVSMRNVLWPLMRAGIEGFKVGGWAKGVGCCGREGGCSDVASITPPPASACVHVAEVVCPCPPRHQKSLPISSQPDKLENGLGHTSPLNIKIPGAERGREWEYYYHDRWAGGGAAFAVVTCFKVGPRSGVSWQPGRVDARSAGCMQLEQRSPRPAILQLAHLHSLPAFCPLRSTHPADRGHQMMAEALAGPLQRAVEEEAAAAAGQLRHSSRRQDERLEVRGPCSSAAGSIDQWSCPVGWGA